jgi:hypothetical protein
MKNIYLQLFLMFDVFIMGVLATTGVRHIFEHFKDKQEGEKTPLVKQAQNIHLPPALRQQLLDEAQTNFSTLQPKNSSTALATQRLISSNRLKRWLMKQFKKN